jgi:hypothetical protein
MIITQAQPVFEIVKPDKIEEATKAVEERNFTRLSEKERAQKEADIGNKMKPPLNLDSTRGKIVDITA